MLSWTPTPRFHRYPVKNGTDGASCSATGPTSPQALAGVWMLMGIPKESQGARAPNGYPSEMAGLSFKNCRKGEEEREIFW